MEERGLWLKGTRGKTTSRGVSANGRSGANAQQVQSFYRPLGHRSLWLWREKKVEWTSQPSFWLVTTYLDWGGGVVSISPC